MGVVGLITTVPHALTPMASCVCVCVCVCVYGPKNHCNCSAGECNQLFRCLEM